LRRARKFDGWSPKDSAFWPDAANSQNRSELMET
jgi:hypothetical protein